MGSPVSDFLYTLGVLLRPDDVFNSIDCYELLYGYACVIWKVAS